MKLDKRIVAFVFLLFVILAIRDIPYINLLFKNNFLTLYVIAIVAFFLLFIKIRARLVYLGIVLLFASSPILALVGLDSLLEGVGVVLYLLIWVLLGIKIYFLVKSKY